jgi:hypothetical protein
MVDDGAPRLWFWRWFGAVAWIGLVACGRPPAAPSASSFW